MLLPTFDDAVRIHNVLTAMFAAEGDPIEPPGIKNENLLRSALDRPNTGMSNGVFFVEKYDTIERKIGSLLHSIINNHPFHNGNKRTALLCALYGIMSNNFTINASDQEIYNLVISVAKHDYNSIDISIQNDNQKIDEVEVISSWLSKRIERLDRDTGTMSVSDFINRCKQYGCRIKLTNRRKVQVQGIENSIISLSPNIRTLNRKVVMKYTKKLGIVSSGGLSLGEFKLGHDPEKELIEKYIDVLKYLSWYDKQLADNGPAL